MLVESFRIKRLTKKLYSINAKQEVAQYKRVVQGRRGKICEIVLNVHRTNYDEV